MESTTNESNTERLGAVLLCDALGFRGLWKTKGTALVESIHRIHNRIELIKKTYNEQICQDLRTSFHAFSDSIAFAVMHPDRQVPPDNSNDRYMSYRCIALCAFAAQIIQSLGGTAAIPLAYRGAISFGQIVMVDRVLMGEAIDEAAAHMESPNAAIIRLTPSASAIVEQREVTDELVSALSATKDSPSAVLRPRQLLFRHPTPMVDGSVIDSFVVNPYFDPQIDARTKLWDGIEESFARNRFDIRVEAKRQYTRAFLSAADSWIKADPEATEKKY